jgi:hypothetical protein
VPDQLVPRPAGLHLILADPWSKEWGQPHDNDIEYWPIPGIVVIDGAGFSENMKGYLMSTGKAIWFSNLEDWLRLFLHCNDQGM